MLPKASFSEFHARRNIIETTQPKRRHPTKELECNTSSANKAGHCISATGPVICTGADMDTASPPGRARQGFDPLPGRGQRDTAPAYHARGGGGDGGGDEDR
jgi:hypothetical protein